MEKNQEREFGEERIEGRNPIQEVLNSDRSINCILVAQGERHGAIKDILTLAREKGVVVKEVHKSKLDELSETGHHQGIIALVSPYKYVEVDDILQLAAKKNETPLVALADGIEDPQNLGTLIRTLEVAGVHGLLIPKRRAASVTPAVVKISAGAAEHLPIARVTNISETIKYLKTMGLWIIGTDMDAPAYYYNTDMTGPVGVVVGSEGRGISRLVKENCDLLVKIPIRGRISSLNAAAACSIVVFDILRQRSKKG